MKKRLIGLAWMASGLAVALALTLGAYAIGRSAVGGGSSEAAPVRAAASHATGKASPHPKAFAPDPLQGVTAAAVDAPEEASSASGDGGVAVAEESAESGSNSGHGSGDGSGDDSEDHSGSGHGGGDDGSSGHGGGDDGSNSGHGSGDHSGPGGGDDGPSH